MTELARRTIDELLVRYELEPGLEDVFVEGKFDQEVLSSFFNGTAYNNRMVYDIDSVDVPDELLIKHGLTGGNKQRVIVLARELADLAAGCSYRCIVDKDLDHWFGTLESTDRLIWSEFCSIELNFFSDEILRNILIATAKAKINMWEEYIESLIETLRNLYALRLADRTLGWSLEWLSINRCLSNENSRVVFDMTDYVERLLQKNRKVGCLSQFDATVTYWIRSLTGDHRNYIRGHDFVDLLALTVRMFRGIKEFSSTVTIQRLFVLLAPNASSLGNVFR